MPSILSRALEMIQSLTFEELRQVEVAVHRRLQQVNGRGSREAFHNALLASGLVNEIKKPSALKGTNRPLVVIQGEPLSRTVVEERR